MVFPCVSLRFNEEFQRVNDLRHLPEKRMACALQIAKQSDYSPEPTISGLKPPTDKGEVSVGRRLQPRQVPTPEPPMSELKLPTYRGEVFVGRRL
ncbi:hypothetical protein H663_002910 [Limnohabitans planktonicus II-D5]|uniref:Uncharacterized protein n=1 Tax=Limnohabitans planktonicus II-D5 TaxID=1293045 RepID=A0A2T7UIC6_9BURK|nr:hypothetical protein H663_002910 [Limnohabitans planktonicus II-D5]